MEAETVSPTFAEETKNNMLKELQSWWEIPSMAQYISLFRETFNLPEIEIEELENGLIDDCIKGPNEWLQNLIIAFLKSIMPGRINPTNWEIHLKRLIKRKWLLYPFAEKENPFAEEISFHELNLRSKVEVLYCFCLSRLDNNDITELMKSMDADALRVQKLGIDDDGNTYWYFYGTRLYKEEPIEEKKTWNEEWEEQKEKTFTKKRGRGRPPKKKTNEKEVEDTAKDDKFMNVSTKSRWSVVCDTLEEWLDLTEKFKNSKSKNEKSLFQIIQENFLPTLSKIYEEKERKLQQKIRELLPAREKIVTRRETRRLRGDTGGEINYALLNGYDSDEDYRRQTEEYKTVEVKSRAERLEERNKRASEAASVQYVGSRKRVKHGEDLKDSSDSSQNSSPDDSESNELDLMSQMIKLMSSVKLHKDAWPFLYPVNEEDAPGYYEIIKDPIDLSMIENRLYKGEYETVGDIDADFSKMVTNCELYNGEQNAFSKMAQTLQKYFRKEVSSLLEMIETVESSNANSEESNDSQYHSSSNSNSSSPPHESTEIESKEHKKVKSKKKKRKHQNMEALDLLAQASDVAVQNSNSNDMLNISNMYDEQKKCNDFPNLKIVPIHSHPPSYIEKYSSKENHSESDSSYINDKMENDGQYLSASPTDSGISSSSESTNYMNNLTNFTSLMEKDSDKNLNILSNSDVTSILQENDSTNHSSVNASSLFRNTVSSGNPHGVDNILDGYSENFISQIMKHPIYNSIQQGILQNKYSYEENFPKLDMNLNGKKEKSSNFAGHATADNNPFQSSLESQSNPGSPSDNITTIDASVLGISLNSRKKKPKNLDISGISFVKSGKVPFDSSQNDEQLKNSNSLRSKLTTSPNEMNQHVSPSFEQPLSAPIMSNQPLSFDYTNPIKNFPTNFLQNLPTYSNSNLPFPMLSPKTVQQQDKSQLLSSVSSFDASNILNSEQNVVPVSSYQPFNLDFNSNNVVPVTFSQTQSLTSSLHYSTSYSKTDQQQAKVQKMDLNNSVLQPFNHATHGQTIASYQPNLNFTYSNSTLPTTFVSTFTSNSNSNLPLHIPATYPKTIEQQVPNSPTNPFRLSKPKPFNHVMVDSCGKKGSAVTYHVYSQTKSKQNSVQEHLNYLNSISAAPIQMVPSSEKRNNQENVVNSPSPPQKKSPIPQEIRPAAYHVPTTNMPCNTASPSSPSTNTSSVPVSSSSFIPVSSSPQEVRKNKPVIIRSNAPTIEKRNSPVETAVSTSLNTAGEKISNIVQQTTVNQSFNPKTIPVVLSTSSPNQGDFRVHNNPMPPVTVQSNLCMPNGLPVVQRVVIPPGTQLQNTGQQFVFASPPNTIRILSKGQNDQMQSNMGQLNQNYVKVVPQLIAPAPGMQSFQIQTISPNNTQAFTQVTQNPQFVSVPYVVSNQNSTTQPTMSYQSFQIPPRPMHIGGQGNS